MPNGASDVASYMKHWDNKFSNDVLYTASGKPVKVAKQDDTTKVVKQDLDNTDSIVPLEVPNEEVVIPKGNDYNPLTKGSFTSVGASVPDYLKDKQPDTPIWSNTFI